MTIKVHVDSETARLRSVIVGYPDNFLQIAPEIINETQKKFYFGPNKPDVALVKAQLDGFADTLAAHGVEVFRPKPLPNIPDQLMTRDIGVVIGNTLVITSMAAQSRRREWRGIADLFAQMEDAEILVAPEVFVLEGGDIVVDKGRIFVGIGQRTTHTGVAWLMTHFPDYEVIPIKLKAVDDGEDVLHLDCSFVPVGDHHALIYPQGMNGVSCAIRDSYELIEVTREEQQTLSTNVLSIGPDTVISRKNSARVNGLMRAAGLNVIELDYSEPPKTGGSFRCCTLPLHRTN